MPELPEVETVCRGITPHIVNQSISAVTVRNFKLRLPVDPDFALKLAGATFSKPMRRAKYLLIPSSKQTLNQTLNKTLICHLGMSGSLCVVDKNISAVKHAHIDIELSNQKILRFIDPRRFGLMILSTNPYQHKLLANLGLEPLADEFTGNYLYKIAQKRTMAIKNLIMTNSTVVGIGNIYATESLFLARIHPNLSSQSLTLKQCNNLVAIIKQVLNKAIIAGGTTLRDFVGADGKLGYFVQQLLIYGKAGKACPVCNSTLEQVKIGGRSSVFCPRCQS